MTIEVFESRLEAVRHTGSGRFMARCPAHEDKRASLSVRELEDGRTLLHCFAGCSVEEVLTSLGLDFDALFPERPTDNLPQKSVKKPWRASDVIRALDFELTVAFVLLSDIGSGREFSAADRERAKMARQRILAFTQELAHAY